MVNLDIIKCNIVEVNIVSFVMHCDSHCSGYKNVNCTHLMKYDFEFICNDFTERLKYGAIKKLGVNRHYNVMEQLLSPSLHVLSIIDNTQRFDW